MRRIWVRIEAQSAAIASYGEHWQRRVGPKDAHFCTKKSETLHGAGRGDAVRMSIGVVRVGYLMRTVSSGSSCPMHASGRTDVLVKPGAQVALGS